MHVRAYVRECPRELRSGKGGRECTHTRAHNHSHTLTPSHTLSLTAIKKIFEEVLDAHNTERTPMQMVMFEMALEHITRIMRIIQLPRGHALLVGVGGSGKQSNVMLSSYCAGYEVFTLQLTRGYDESQFKEDLKVLYEKVSTKQTCFLFTDAHVVEEGFLESINNFLNTGTVPGLFEKDEMDG